MLSSSATSKSQSSCANREASLTAPPKLSSPPNPITTTTNTTNTTYKQLQETNVKLRRHSFSKLLLSSDHSYHMDRLNHRSNNHHHQLSHCFNRSTSNIVKQYNLTLNKYPLALRLKHRARCFNEDQQQKKQMKLFNAYYEEFFIQNSNSKLESVQQLQEDEQQQCLDSVSDLPPSGSSLSVQSQSQPQQQQHQPPSSSQKRVQQHWQRRRQHSKSWNVHKSRRSSILDEWKRKSDTVQPVSLL
ncbi:unnamed protein product [Schistosoma turkestanicum]|nr:unnamed protein product [Schistosoma turkestanicum]